jgi:hypothetical protein
VLSWRRLVSIIGESNSVALIAVAFSSFLDSRQLRTFGVRAVTRILCPPHRFADILHWFSDSTTSTTPRCAPRTRCVFDRVQRAAFVIGPKLTANNLMGYSGSSSRSDQVLSQRCWRSQALPNRFWVPVRVRDLSKVVGTQPTRYDRLVVSDQSRSTSTVVSLASGCWTLTRLRLRSPYQRRCYYRLPSWRRDRLH